MNENIENNIVDSENHETIDEVLADVIESFNDSVESQSEVNSSVLSELKKIDKANSTQSDSNALLLAELKKINAYNEEQSKQALSDKQAAEEQAKIEEQEQAEADQEAQEQADQEAQIASEKEASEVDYKETVQEILVDIRSQNELQNELSVVNIICFGIISGLLFIKILVDRIIKL